MRKNQFTVLLVSLLTLTCILPAHAIKCKKLKQLRERVERRLSGATSKTQTRETATPRTSGTTHRTSETSQPRAPRVEQPLAAVGKAGQQTAPAANIGSTSAASARHTDIQLPKLKKSPFRSWHEEAVDEYLSIDPAAPSLTFITSQPIWRPKWEEGTTLRSEDFFPGKTFASQQKFLDYLAEQHNKHYINVARNYAPKVLADLKAHASDFEKEAQGMATFNRPQQGDLVPEYQAAEMIPANIDNIFIAEFPVAGLPEKMIPLFDAIQKRMGEREVIVLTNALPQGHVWNTARDAATIEELPLGSQIEHHYRMNLWKALEKQGVKIVGLEPEVSHGALDRTGKTEGFFYSTLPGQNSPKLWTAWGTEPGTRARHQQWLQTLEQQRAEHPDAAFVIYIPSRDASYIHPLSFTNQVAGKNFVVEVLEKEGRETHDFFDLQMGADHFPANLKWSPELAKLAGFDMRIKFDRKPSQGIRVAVTDDGMIPIQPQSNF